MMATMEQKNMSWLWSSNMRLVQIRHRGFSIVELMVAILIGLIILAGVIQVVVTSKTTFLGQEEMSFIQENARYTVDVIGKDLQSAGYWGCAGSKAKVAIVALNAEAGGHLIGTFPVGGFDGSQQDAMPDFIKSRVREISSADPVGYPDVLIVRGAETSMVGVKSHDANEIETASAHGLSEKSYFVVVGEDCRRMAIVRTGTVSGNKITYNATPTENCSTAIKPSLLKASYSCTDSYESYLPGATLMKYSAHAYFIGNSSAIDGFPALKRVFIFEDGVREEELALGVEDMDVLYGINSNGNVQYKPANEITANEWAQVHSVQVQLVFRSQTGSGPAREQQFLEKTYNDNFMRQMVSTTFRLRNRI